METDGLDWLIVVKSVPDLGASVGDLIMVDEGRVWLCKRLHISSHLLSSSAFQAVKRDDGPSRQAQSS